MRVAHFVQRYPPALGGSEDYFARLSRHLAAHGDHVTVFTTTAVDLPAFWSTSGRCLRPGRRIEDGVEIRRYHLWHLPYQTRVLKALSFLPYRPWQCLTVSCNPIAWRMWVEAGQARDRFDVVHATAFPYGWPLACARRLARRLGVPFLLTPFLHLGDPDDPHDRTRRAYTSPALLSLAQSADCLFVQTEGERQAFLERGIPAERLILQGMGLDRESCTGGDRRRSAGGLECRTRRGGNWPSRQQQPRERQCRSAARRRTRLASRRSFRRCPRRPGDAEFPKFLARPSTERPRHPSRCPRRPAEARFLRRHRCVRSAESIRFFRAGVAGSMGQWGAEHRLSRRRHRLGDPRREGRLAGALRRHQRLGCGDAAFIGGCRAAAPFGLRLGWSARGMSSSGRISSR